MKLERDVSPPALALEFETYTGSPLLRVGASLARRQFVSHRTGQVEIAVDVPGQAGACRVDRFVARLAIRRIVAQCNTPQESSDQIVAQLMRDCRRQCMR